MGGGLAIENGGRHLPRAKHDESGSGRLSVREFVTTERDRERAVYDSPKDRHVFPWIEGNARFGLIRRR